MLISDSPSAASDARDARAPLMYTRFLPDRDTTLRTMSSSPSPNPSSLILFLNPSCSRMVKSASTTAASSKERIMSAFALSPNRRPTAPMMIDFPAPVSPEMMLRPPSKVTFNSSMMAKFRMFSSVSILPLPGGPRLRTAPPQFRPQDLQIAPMGGGDQGGDAARFPDRDGVSGFYGKRNLPVEGHGRPLLQGPQRHLDLHSLRQDDGPVGQRMGAYRVDDDRIELGK